MSTNFYSVETKEQDYWEGVFIGKRAGGWVPQFKWHRENFCSCDCPDGTHNYRNWDELKEFLRRNNEQFVKDEYGESYTASEFIEMMEEWKEENNKEPDSNRGSTWKIDGWWFIKGNWC